LAIPSPDPSVTAGGNSRFHGAFGCLDQIRGRSSMQRIAGHAKTHGHGQFCALTVDSQHSYTFQDALRKNLRARRIGHQQDNEIVSAHCGHYIVPPGDSTEE
jgi:hypothetical protein